MSNIDNVEVFFLEYPFPQNLNYQYSAGLVENMIVGLIKVTDDEGDYGLGEVTHAQFTHKPIVGLIDHFKDVLRGMDVSNINQAWEKNVWLKCILEQTGYWYWSDGRNQYCTL